MEKVVLKAKDSIKLSANFWPSKSKKGAILLHQFNNSKESYSALAEALHKKAFQVIALDLRGHGESKAPGTLASPVYLSPKDFQGMKLDISSAKAFLKEKGATDFFLVGASIGANLAIIFPQETPGFKAAVALSPGEDYKGLKPFFAAEKTSVPTMLVASREDAYSFHSARKIADLLSAPKKVVELTGAGHGTFMLENESSLNEKIVEWFEENS